jgi:hypothetical protein
MKQEEITQNNKLIAEFMGPDSLNVKIGNTEIYPHLILSELGVDALIFHTSWDWLMSVVEKINKRDWVTIKADECKIHPLDIDDFKEIVVNEQKDLITAVFYAVVKYIKWYNENK